MVSIMERSFSVRKKVFFPFCYIDTHWQERERERRCRKTVHKRQHLTCWRRSLLRQLLLALAFVCVSPPSLFFLVSAHTTPTYTQQQQQRAFLSFSFQSIVHDARSQPTHTHTHTCLLERVNRRPRCASSSSSSCWYIKYTQKDQKKKTDDSINSDDAMTLRKGIRVIKRRRWPNV